MLFRRSEIEQEERRLAPYACKAAESRGRENPIAPDPWRTAFQRDRDRIIHASAFRKLEFKTQVFMTTAGDYHRTRLTHTAEVAQIARIIARALGLNVDLTEAIALAHDLGHTPFGHAGEEAMRVSMKDHGGFEHNAQGLRIVEILEERYPDHPGLNLTFEVREGIIKHDTLYDSPAADERYLPGQPATLECQVVDIADEIAYNCADLDDALKLAYIEEEDLLEIPWLDHLFQKARNESGTTSRRKYRRFAAIGELYEFHVHDALIASNELLQESGAGNVDEVREAGRRLVDFSPETKRKLAELKQFLLRRVYLHPKTLQNSERGRRFITTLFQTYIDKPALMPFKYQKRIEADGLHRVVCDYISGMTDRYLHEQYRGLFHPEIFK